MPFLLDAKGHQAARLGLGRSNELTAKALVCVIFTALSLQATVLPAWSDAARAATVFGDDTVCGNEVAPRIEPASQLHGNVTRNIYPSPAERLDELVSCAIERHGDTDQLARKDRRYGRFMHKLVAVGSDVANFATSYKGFELSSEAADVILDEKLKLKSKSAVEYAKQRQLDRTHASVASCMMQLAMGLGMTDKIKADSAINAGLSQLSELVGEHEARQTLDALKQWYEGVKLPESLYDQGPWEIIKLQQKTDVVLDHALNSDKVVAEIREKLHKYNRHSKLSRATSKVVNTILSIAAFTPNFISPAAQVAWTAYVMSTGGTEGGKLIKELYLDKRFESRWRMLNQETALAINAYHSAILMKNPALLAFSVLMIEKLAGQETSNKVLGTSTHSQVK